jgi:hypothetical protein
MFHVTSEADLLDYHLLWHSLDPAATQPDDC